MVGEIREGEDKVREYPEGKPPLKTRLRLQPLRLKVGLWLMVFGFLAQAFGTVLGL